MPRVEFFYDLSSPWTRLAFANIQPIAAETGCSLTWRPFLVGGVFNAVNPELYKGRANAGGPRSKLWGEWLKEWARLAGVAMNFPSVHHPLRSVAAMRFCCAIGRQEDLRRFSEAAFDAYFRDQRNLDEVSELVLVADGCGLDGEQLATLAASPPVKDLLRSNTAEAIARGAFGSPTIFVDGDHLYFGNDQLPLVRSRLLA